MSDVELLSTTETLMGAAKAIDGFGASVAEITLPKVQDVEVTTPSKPHLNLGCGTIILPAARPDHHHLVDEGIYEGQTWYNVDKVANAGVDQVFDLFSYPWPLADNSYSGALASHLCEHIPHEIALSDERWLSSVDIGLGYTSEAKKLAQLQDGWFAFFSELSRVLEPGAIAHVLSPFGQSTDAMIDPTHTRFLFPHTFQYFVPNPDAPFQYNLGSRWEIVGQPMLALTPRFQHLAAQPEMVHDAMQIYFNVVNAFYIKLRNVK